MKTREDLCKKRGGIKLHCHGTQDAAHLLKQKTRLSSAFINNRRKPGVGEFLIDCIRGEIETEDDGLDIAEVLDPLPPLSRGRSGVDNPRNKYN